jgi:ATPase subunit of ABC transporter with duplicated ATPase domains
VCSSDLFTSNDQELVSTVANRIIYIEEEKVFDKKTTYDDFIDWLEDHQRSAD